MSATPRLPWTAKPALDSAYEWDILNAAGWRVAEVIQRGPDEGLPVAANAALIVQAVNAHAALVEALERLLPDKGHLERCIKARHLSAERCTSDCARARAALALARGEGAR